MTTIALVLLLLSAAAGKQPCQPQQPTALTPFDTCKYLPITLPQIHGPRILSSPAPEYPQTLVAKRAGIRDSVAVVLAINDKGGVDDVKVARSSSDARFEQNAIDAARVWKFTPATKDGKPVAVQMKVELTFETH